MDDRPSWVRMFNPQDSKAVQCNSRLLPPTNMIHLTTFFALVIGGMEAIQPAAAGVMPGLSANINTFQRRQNNPSVPPQCATVCSSVTPVIASLNVSR
jgi:hypothetical protein